MRDVKAEQVPKEAIEAAAVMLSNGKTTAQALAAAINAWPGMHVRTDDWCSPADVDIVLPLDLEKETSA